MRKWWILVTGAVVVASFVGIAPAGAKASKPVTLDGKVNVKGTKDISTKKTASIELEADDYYFEPTFVKVQPGEKVSIDAEERGQRQPHVHVGQPGHRQDGGAREVGQGRR